MGAWIFGVVLGFLSLLGLFIAGRAHDAAFELFGFALFAFGVLMIFGLIARYTGHPRGDRH